MEFELWKVVVLAIVQGATEFLPVSSSGHLVIVAAFLTKNGDAAGLEIPDLNIFLHGGTLVSILVFYWNRIWRLVLEDRRTSGLLIVGTIPAVAVGLPLKRFAEESILGNPLVAGCLLPVTGLILLSARKWQQGQQQYQDLTIAQALLIGLSQAFAILPGISRSGTTISAGARLGLAPNSAATFSFLLAIPTIGGACVLEIVSLFGKSTPTTPLGHLLIGAAVAFAVGLVCLYWLVKWIERGKLHLFAWWCIGLGLLVVAWQLST